MNGWNLFDSAPTNGTEVLVYRKDAGVFMASFRPSAGDEGEFGPQFNGDDCWFDNYGCDLTDDLPTHWMPLPSPPDAALQSALEALRAAEVILRLSNHDFSTNDRGKFRNITLRSTHKEVLAAIAKAEAIS